MNINSILPPDKLELIATEFLKQSYGPCPGCRDERFLDGDGYHVRGVYYRASRHKQHFIPDMFSDETMGMIIAELFTRKIWFEPDPAGTGLYFRGGLSYSAQGFRSAKMGFKVAVLLACYDIAKEKIDAD